LPAAGTPAPASPNNCIQWNWAHIPGRLLYRIPEQERNRDQNGANGSKPPRLLEFTGAGEEAETEGKHGRAIGNSVLDGLIQAGDQSEQNENQSHRDAIDDLVWTDHATIIANPWRRGTKTPTPKYRNGKDAAQVWDGLPDL
jgi:hypothetical protein